MSGLERGCRSSLALPGVAIGCKKSSIFQPRYFRTQRFRPACLLLFNIRACPLTPEAVASGRKSAGPTDCCWSRVECCYLMVESGSRKPLLRFSFCCSGARGLLYAMHGSLLRRCVCRSMWRAPCFANRVLYFYKTWTPPDRCWGRSMCGVGLTATFAYSRLAEHCCLLPGMFFSAAGRHNCCVALARPPHWPKSRSLAPLHPPRVSADLAGKNAPQLFCS